jgi:hypothetical protein
VKKIKTLALTSRPVTFAKVQQRSAYVNFFGERCSRESFKASGVEQNGFRELLGGGQKAVLCRRQGHYREPSLPN